MKKIIAVFITAVIAAVFAVTGMNITASAANIPGGGICDPTHLYADEPICKLSIDASKTANWRTTVQGKNASVTKIELSHYLQEQNGSFWTTICGHSKTYYGWYCSEPYSREGLESGNYRVKVVAVVYCGEKSETITFYSLTESC